MKELYRNTVLWTHSVIFDMWNAVQKTKCHYTAMAAFYTFIRRILNLGSESQWRRITSQKKRVPKHTAVKWEQWHSTDTLLSLRHQPVLYCWKDLRIALSKVKPTMRDRRLSPRLNWTLQSPGLLRGVRWSENDVSGLPFDPILKNQFVGQPDP